MVISTVTMKKTLLEVSILLGYDVASLDDWCHTFRQTTWLSLVEEFAVSMRPICPLAPKERKPRATCERPTTGKGAAYWYIICL